MENNQNENKFCEICGIKANSLCLQCISYFCDSCYKFIYDKELNNLHKKENIDYFVPIDIKCLSHPKYPMELFCLDEKRNIKINIIYFLN